MSWAYWKQVLISIDQLLNAIFAAMPTKLFLHALGGTT